MDYFSLDQKIALARSLVTKTSPAYVQFYITARCNLACEQSTSSMRTPMRRR